MQACFFTPSSVFFVPSWYSESHKTALTYSQSCKGRAVSHFGGTHRPTPGHGTGTHLKVSAVPVNPAFMFRTRMPLMVYHLSAIDHKARERGRAKTYGHCPTTPITLFSIVAGRDYTKIKPM